MATTRDTAISAGAAAAAAPAHDGLPSDADSAADDATVPVDARELSRLKWRCRRGMLENDLLIERFFARHEASLTRSQARGLQVLMELPDNDLLALLLGRTQPEGELAAAEVREVLDLLRPARPLTAADGHP